jgi:flagellar basal-body rod modification protein FlgD
MSIAGLEPIDVSNNTSSASTQSTLGRDDFLNLLITQLQNQDPLSPMDSTEFSAQLAQFSSLEQLSNVNENLETLQLFQSSLNNAQAVSFIGKSIKASGDTVLITDGVPDKIHFELAGDASDVFVNIYDADGNFVATQEGGSLNAGRHDLSWDGTDHEGNEMPDGVYSFEIMAVDVNNEMVDVNRYTSGKVTGVTYRDGITYLLSGDKMIPMGNIIEVTED